MRRISRTVTLTATKAICPTAARRIRVLFPERHLSSRTKAESSRPVPFEFSASLMFEVGSFSAHLASVVVGD